MITISIDNVFSTVIGFDFNAQHAIYEALSYEDAKLKFQKNRGYSVNPVVSLYNLDKQTFLTGLLPRVLGNLNAYGVQYELVDLRKLPISKLNAPDLEGIELRPYQRDAAYAGIKKARGMLKLATGAGKTEIAAAITKMLDVETIFLTHRVSLLRQSYARFKKRMPHLADQLGVIGDDEYRPGKITFATVQTIQSMCKSKSPDVVQKIREELAKYKCLIIDEAHRASSDYFLNASNLCTGAYFRLGLSATPFMGNAGDNMIVEGIMGDVLHSVTASQLIEMGVLARPYFRFVYINEPFDINDYKEWRDIYENGIINNDFRNDVIAKQTKTLVDMGKKTLLIVIEKEHGKQLIKKLKKDKIKAQYIDGSVDTEGREKALGLLESGKADCVVCTNIFDEGIDTGCIGGIVLAGGTKSAPALFQRTGRAMRKKEEENYCVVVDFIDRTHPKLYEHSMLRYNLIKQEEGFRIL